MAASEPIQTDAAAEASTAPQGAGTTAVAFSGVLTTLDSVKATSLQPLTMSAVRLAREASSRDLSTAASAATCCDSAGGLAACNSRVSALEARCEDIRSTLRQLTDFPDSARHLVREELTEKLMHFQTELDRKLVHLEASHARIEEQSRDVANHLDAAKQCRTVSARTDTLLEASICESTKTGTDITQEVGRLRSFIETDVHSLRSRFQAETARVEQIVLTVSKSEAAIAWLNKRISEIGLDVSKLQESGKVQSESMLRSRLSVLHECDPHASEEQNCQPEESGSLRNCIMEEPDWATSLEVHDLSERLHRLEKTCQQAMTMPSRVLELSQNLRAEVQQVLDPVRQDMDCLKQAMDACGHQTAPRCGDTVEASDSEQYGSARHAASLHQRLLGLEVAHAVDSRKSGEFEQHLSKLERGLAQERCNTLTIVNSHMTELTQTVETVRKQQTAMQDQIQGITDSVSEACASGIMKAEAILTRELVTRNMGTSNGDIQQQQQELPQIAAEGTGNVVRNSKSSDVVTNMCATAFPRSLSPVEQPPWGVEAEGARDMVRCSSFTAGVTGISASQSDMTRHVKSSTNLAPSSQTPTAFQASGSSVSGSYHALAGIGSYPAPAGSGSYQAPAGPAAFRDMKAVRIAAASGPSIQPSLQPGAPCASLAAHLVSPRGPSLSKAVGPGLQISEPDGQRMNVSRPSQLDALPCSPRSSPSPRPRVDRMVTVAFGATATQPRSVHLPGSPRSSIPSSPSPGSRVNRRASVPSGPASSSLASEVAQTPCLRQHLDASNWSLPRNSLATAARARHVSGLRSPERLGALAT